MQNIDFYSGKADRDKSPHFSPEEPEYFSKMANIHSKEEEKSMKRATRMLFLIVALCIISFTLGLVIGIKYVNGSQKDIVDVRTKKAVDDIGNKVANLMKESAVKELNAAPVRKNLFSRTQFPYAIKIPGEHSKTKSQEIANYLSNKGQTVVLSKNNGKYRIFLGPYRNMVEADMTLDSIKKYSGQNYISKAEIVKR